MLTILSVTILALLEAVVIVLGAVLILALVAVPIVLAVDEAISRWGSGRGRDGRRFR
ncbi:MAG: hypothetical protein ACRDQA_26680 [Nocardioidaceae bacterium]